jgi:hypothetical protein
VGLQQPVRPGATTPIGIRKRGTSLERRAGALVSIFLEEEKEELKTKRSWSDEQSTG